MKIQKQAFTLVELIVVITILAILWTIAFISLQWYSTQARDSTRLSDISTMKTSLELFHLWAWKYPQPTDGVAITYSWWTVWTQWTFGNSVFINVDKLDKIPTDPLTDKKYTYSVTTNEYELAWMLEWDPLTFNPYMLDGAFAWTVEATAIVEWNYNWLMWKSLTWASTCYALALPTIVANDVSNPDLLQIMTNERLVYNWYKNLPSNLSSTKFDTTGWFAFGSWIPLVAYTDNASCGPLTNVDDSTARVSLINWLQTAYTSTILESVWEVAKIVNLTAWEEESYAASFVNNNLWGKIEIIINSNEEPWEFDLCSVQWDILSSTSTYWTCDTLDIIVCSWESTWYTISSCNIWSSIAWLTNISYWNYFQWWRNKWFPEADSSSQSTIINWTIWLDAWTDTYWFVYNWSLPSPWTWADSDINDNWWELTNSQFARQWPCEIWYHVPSLAEWWLLHAAWWWANWWELSVGLNLPLAGYRLQNTWVIIYKTSNWYYWSSSYNTNNWEYLHFYSWWGSINSSWANDYRAKWMNIRCFKNN
jgi:prepilin-type N-terminal cleavage/methylation domain-containing protein